MANKSNTKEFVDKVTFIHNYKFDYSLVIYINNSTKVKIICPIHGVFEQMPATHLRGHGCRFCDRSNKSNTKEFVDKASFIHNYKFDYSLVIYINNSTKVKIICPIHGIFKQSPGSHLNGNGCPMCSKNKKFSTEDFIKKAIEVHGDRYDYSLVIYFNAFKKVKIICKEHGVFEQLPTNHLSGKNGCPICCSSKGEEKIRNWLMENKFLFTEQHRFKDCKNKLSLSFDFYLPKLNICIEYDGIQHFKPISYFGGEEKLLFAQKSDKIKTKYCKDNKIKLIRIKYLDFKKIETKLNQYLKENIKKWK